MANSEVRPAREQGAGKWHVPVTVDGFSSNMVVIKTQGGNKIDWEASMSLVQADFEKSEEVQTAAFIKRWGLENAKLEIKVLKVYQKFSFTYFDLEVRNRSDAFLDFWGLVGVIYDSGDKYLGKSITNGKNLTPGDTAFVSIRFSDVNYATVKSWKFTLSDIDLSNDSGENVDAIQHFSIIVPPAVKPPVGNNPFAPGNNPGKNPFAPGNNAGDDPFAPAAKPKPPAAKDPFGADDPFKNN
jgi:hypothetical protein